MHGTQILRQRPRQRAPEPTEADIAAAKDRALQLYAEKAASVTRTRVIPFIGHKGDVVARVDGYLCLFDRRGAQPEAGIEIEIMFCSTTPRRADSKVSALIVQPVTDDHVLVHHKGFDCFGSMCRTTARLDAGSDDYLQSVGACRLGTITPGRTPVEHVSNITTKWVDGKPAYNTPNPGAAYVSRGDLVEHHSRIAGVPTLDQIEYGVLRALVRNQARKTLAVRQED